jgi:hypothetical protein
LPATALKPEVAAALTSLLPDGFVRMISEVRLVQRCDAAFIPFDAFLRFVPIRTRHCEDNLLIAADDNELVHDD